MDYDGRNTGFDPGDPQDVTRLRRSIASARQKLERYRNNRKFLLEALMDPCHQTAYPNTEDRKPVNSLDKMVSILTRGVVDQNPTRRIVKTKRPRVAGMLKTRLERWSEQIDLAAILQSAFHEALLRWGIVYMGVEGGDNGWTPYAETLKFDDYFIDLRGDDEQDVDFEGHDYCRRLGDLLDNPLYDQQAVQQLYTGYAGRKSNDQSYTLYDWVELRSVWLPREGLIVVLAGGDYTTVDRPVRVVQYQGPPWGPYLRVRLGSVRGTMIPVSRASMLFDMHDFEQRAYRHVFVQADRQVEFFGYAGESERDAEKHRTAMDGEYLKFENPQGVVRYAKGGVNPQTLATAMHASQRFNEDAGNLNLAGGLAASAETLGQERALGVGVQQMIAESRAKMNKLAKRIDETAVWYMLRDPQHEEVVEWKTPNGNTVPSRWTPGMTEGMAPDDPDMEIIPGSMISRTAEQQLSSLVESFQVIGSAMALPGEQPPVFRHRRFRELVADYRNQPEIAELFGEAPDAASVVPGVEQAAQFAQQGQQGPSPQGQGGGNKLVERLIYSGGQPAPA